MRRLLLVGALLLGIAGSGSAQIVGGSIGGAGVAQRLCAFTNSVGNGADLTADVLQTCTLAAGQLANVGDTIHVIAGGTMGATTDNKNAIIKFGATQQVGVNGVTASAARWYAEVWFVKTGPSAQSYVALGAQIASSSGTNSATTAITDTAPIAITVSGQNSTNSVAGSVTCQVFIVDFIRGS